MNSPLLQLRFSRQLALVRTFGTRQEKHEYYAHFKTIPLSSLSEDFVPVPIHHQDHKELLKTIVKGGKALISNQNFWKKCSRAFLYNRHHFTVKELVKIVNAFGKAKYDDSFLFNQIASLLLQNRQNLSIADIPIVLHACSECKYHNKELFGTLYSILSENLENVGRHGLVMAIHAANRPELVEVLSKKILENIKGFAIEDILMMLSSMSRLGCKDIAVLQNVSSHLISLSPGFSLTRALQLSEILIAFNYIDRNFFWLISSVVCSAPQLIPSNEIMVLLKVLKLCKTCSVLDVSPHFFKAITNMVINDSSNVITAFGANTVFSELNHSNIYLNQLCAELAKVIPNYSVKERIEILDECTRHGMRIMALYDIILESLENPRNVQGLTSLKYKEVLDAVFKSKSHLLEALEVEYGKVSAQPKALDETPNGVDTHYRPIAKTPEEVLTAYDYVIYGSSKASQVEVALAICHADSTEYKRGLVKQLGRDVPAELIPAVLRSLLHSLEAEEDAEANTYLRGDPIYPTVAKLCDCLFYGGLGELSNRSLSALIALFCRGPLKSGSILIKREWIKDLAKELEKRIDALDGHKDILEGNLLTKSAIILLRNGGFDEPMLSRCLCKNVTFINPKQIPALLDSFVKSGFNDGESLKMLEPCIERCDGFDIRGSLKIEKLCNALGISTKQPLEEPPDDASELQLSSTLRSSMSSHGGMTNLFGKDGLGNGQEKLQIRRNFASS